MATVTHYISSEYDPELDKDRLLRETGQATQDDEDPWQTESSSAGFHSSRRLANAPKFVPALLSYDEWAASSPNAEPTPGASGSHHCDVASWYKSLNRQGGANPRQQQQAQPRPTSQSSFTRNRSTEATPVGLEPPRPPSSSPYITPTASSFSGRVYRPTATTLSSSTSSSKQKQLDRDRATPDWFIARAISQSKSTSASAPPTPRPNPSNSSLADILSRHPPSEEPFRPPVFLHLGPSNKGWAMLQSQGWSEGEGLGASSNSCRNRDDAPVGSKEDKLGKRKRTRTRSLDIPSPYREPATEECVLADDDDDPIIEVRRKVHVPIIDLTQSDTEDEEEDAEAEEEEDESDKDNDDSDNDSDDHDHDHDSTHAPAPPASTTNHDPTVASTRTCTSDPRAAQTALLTPLPTILKSDRLGIGLKAKTEGPHHSSVKRVTPNAAALAAHVKSAEDMRRTQRLLGKGHRAFARAERIERERRQNMMAYLSEP